MTQATIHELFVWKLSKELARDYDRVRTNVFLHDDRRVLAEIDVLAEKDGEVHVYEVKKSLRPTKARLQFRKIRKHFAGDIAKYFLYAADADRLLELRP